MPSSSPPRVEDVLEFLTSHGFSRAASALRDDVIERGEREGSPPPLPPPVRIPGGRSFSRSSSSSASGDFVSMGSSPFDLLNPCGVWSPLGPKSEDSSARQSEFETARDYNNSNIFGDSCWYDEQCGDYLRDPFFAPTAISSNFHSEDKFVMSIEAEAKFREECRSLGITDKPEIYSCSFPLCDCCNGSAEKNKISNSSIYGRYQIMADETEILDEFGEDEFQLKKVDRCPEAVVWKNNYLYDQDQTTGESSKELSPVKKEPPTIDSYTIEKSKSKNNCIEQEHKNNEKGNILTNTDYEDLGKRGYEQPVADKYSQLDDIDGYGFGPFGTSEREFEDSGATGVDGEDNGLDNERQLYGSHEEEYDIFELRIIHRKNRTGFEDKKDFPIILNSVIAGRYYITEYLGSAAFSNVVQAHDLQTGIDVCLKIIKNDKDFFDQSLDEIKLLKFVNKHDPADQCHILRLYDYFYHQEHLFIVSELLRANLYEFQKYNQDSGGEVYFTLHRIQAIARQCLEALEYLHHLRIVHCDLKPENILIKSYSRCEVKIIDLGSSCFLSDNLCLYVQSRSYRAPEVIIGLPYDEKIDIWSLGCVLAELYTGDVLFPNESLVMMLARIIGILGPIETELLSKGQETHKYFTDDYDLYHKNEETGQIEYLIPERSSLAHELQVNDSAFLDFLHCLLQINPKKRPTASRALDHRWLSVSYP